MARKPRLRAQSGVYHVVMQAVRYRNLFLDEEDYLKFKEIVRKVEWDEEAGKRNISLYAYCLMPAYFHLLLKEEKQNVSLVMSRIATAYAHYFNNKYDQDGAIYRGRFASEPVEDDGRFNILLRYIQQVPVRQGVVDSPEDFRQSSFNELIVDSNGMAENALCVLREEYATLPKESLRRQLCSMVPATIHCLEPRRTAKSRPSDGQLMSLIHKMTGVDTINELLSKPYEERLKALATLREKGASVRQLERLTGIGRSIILNLGASK